MPDWHAGDRELTSLTLRLREPGKLSQQKDGASLLRIIPWKFVFLQFGEHLSKTPNKHNSLLSFCKWGQSCLVSQDLTLLSWVPGSFIIIIITTGPAHRECFLPRNTDLLKPKSNTQALDIMTSFAFPLSLLLLLLLLSHLVMSDSLWPHGQVDLVYLWVAVMGWMYPTKRYVEVFSCECEAIFGDKVFIDVIKSRLLVLDWALNSVTGDLVRTSTRIEDTDTHTEQKAMKRKRQGWSDELQSKELQGPLVTIRHCKGQEGFFHSLRDSMGLVMPWFLKLWDNEFPLF